MSFTKNKDARSTFSTDSLRLKDQREQVTAPPAGGWELYMKDGILTAMDSDGVEAPVVPVAKTITLVGGTKVVPSTAVTASSNIFLASQADGGTPGFVRVSARTPGTSFTITSSQGTDTSKVAWVIL